MTTANALNGLQYSCVSASHGAGIKRKGSLELCTEAESSGSAVQNMMLPQEPWLMTENRGPKKFQCFSGFLTATQLVCGMLPDETKPLSVRLATVLYNDHQPS